MKKQIFSFVLVISIIASLFVTLPITANAETEGVFTYSISNGEVTITDCETSTIGDIEIPGTIEYCPVTAIDSYAFDGCEKITGVTIPDSVSSIGDYAFRSCINLTNIKIPDGVTHIGNYLFSDCDALINVTLPNTVTSIGDHAFYSCDSIVDIAIPENVTTIENYAFYSCDSLSGISIPDGVTSIGDKVFYGCHSLTGITIPSSVTSMGTSVFYDCTITDVIINADIESIKNRTFYSCSSLKNVAIPISVTNIETYAFSRCDSLTDVYYAGTEDEWNAVTINSNNDSLSEATIHFGEQPPLLSIYNYTVKNCEITITGCDENASGEIEIPAKIGGYPVTAIGAEAFFDHKTLTDITIPNSVTSIGEFAFFMCEGLTSMIIPNGITTLCESVFDGCINLADISIPDSVTTIGDFAFNECYSLENIPLPKTLTSIGEFAFQDCSGLKYITIPDSVTTIGEAAFNLCTGIETVTIPANVSNIGAWAFSQCDSLTSINVDEDNQNYSSVDGVLFDKDVTSLIQYPIKKGSTSYNIPESVATIEEGAFELCTGIETVTIPANVSTIGTWAFSQCESLTSINVDEDNQNYSSVDGVLFDKDVTTLITYPTKKGNTAYNIPEGVTKIAGDAFICCTNLNNITIPASVTSIGNFATYGCDSLTDIYYSGTEAEWNAIEIGVENENLTNATIHFKEDAFLKRDLAKLISDTYGLLSDFSIGESPFPDIDESDPNYEEILACEKAGIMVGNEDGTFNPDYAITNAELSAFLYKTLAYIDYSMEVPDDAEYDKTKWYGEFAWIMENLGVMENISDWEAPATIDSIGESFYTIGEEYYLRIREGDANEDHAVDVKDVIAIRQFIAGGYNVTIDENIANVNGDAIVDVKDVILLRQHIAGGYDVEL